MYPIQSDTNKKTLKQFTLYDKNKNNYGDIMKVGQLILFHTNVCLFSFLFVV